jgi:hypothetical protein
MPRVEGPVRVSSVLGDERDGLSRHLFVGGNAFMLRMLSKYRAELGVQATAAELEATARATLRQLREDTATVEIEELSLGAGTLTIGVVVRNLTGHKFPTGYPSRRTWLHVTVRNAQGSVVFESGRVSPDGSVVGSDSDADASRFEPHHVEITSPDQVQVYESIIGTPAGTPTTGLLQATQYLKDNRLLPRGFDKATAPGEVAVFGGARTDADFTGDGDRVAYRVPVTGAGPYRVDVELLYQSISYRWAHNLEAYDAPEPRAFLRYYQDLASTSAAIVARAARSVR